MQKCIQYHLWDYELHVTKIASTQQIGVNSSTPNTTNMHQWTGSALVQVMACHQFGAKPITWTNVDFLSIGL